MNPYYENLTGSDPLVSIINAITNSSGGLVPNQSYGPMSPVSKDFFKTEPKEYTAQRQTASESFTLDETVKQNLVYDNSKVENVVSKPQAVGGQKPKNSDINSGGVSSSISAPKYTEDQIMFYSRSASYLVQSMSDFSNALLATGNAKLKARSYEFTANQYERASELLEKNISDINRAARMDANVNKLQGKETKSKQATSMAASGFAVGKGSYKTTFATTDARTNYNIAMRMLKAGLQTAEVTRKAGEYKARAEIERGNAEMSRIKGRADMWNGVISGVGNLVNAGFNFYIGDHGLNGAGKTTTFKNNMGGTSTVLHGGYTKLDI